MTDEPNGEVVAVPAHRAGLERGALRQPQRTGAAVDVTPGGALRVTVRGESGPGYPLVTVRDLEIGLSPAQRAELIERLAATLHDYHRRALGLRLSRAGIEED